MKVAELEGTMTNMEFVRWQVFYGMKAQREELAMKKSQRGRKR